MADYFLADYEMDDEILRRRGRKPKPVWVDGQKIDSIKEAQVRLKIYSADMDEFWYCAQNGHLFRGHVVRMTEPRPPRPPRQIRVRVAVAVHLPGEPLLVGNVTHRLGAWKGQDY